MEQIAVIAEAIGSRLVPPLVPLEAGAAGPA
jgi:hypothetical protein